MKKKQTNKKKGKNKERKRGIRKNRRILKNYGNINPTKNILLANEEILRRERSERFY